MKIKIQGKDINEIIFIEGMREPIRKQNPIHFRNSQQYRNRFNMKKKTEQGSHYFFFTSITFYKILIPAVLPLSSY